MTTYNQHILGQLAGNQLNYPAQSPLLVNTGNGGSGGAAGSTVTISNGGTGVIPGGWLNSNSSLTIGSQLNSAFQIRGDTEPVLSINQDGTIVTKSGTISVDDWIQVVKLMRQFIIDVANDEETAKKYPYLKDAAHQWMMNELRK